MDLRRIRHFTVLAETLNFRRAAERLHMAQPPLTVSIQKLEAELGVKVFMRGATGVSLTPQGRALLADAHKLLFHGDQLRNAARGMIGGTCGILRIGFVGTAAWGMLQKLVPAFRAQYPGVELDLREETSAVIAQQVEDRTLDVGLVRTPLVQATRMKLEPLTVDEFVIALPRCHRLAARRSLRLAQLADEPFIMYAANSAAGLHGAAMLACQQSGFVPRVAQQATQVQTLLALVESGLGVALVPSVMKRYASEEIAYKRLLDLPAASPVGLALAYDAGSESAAVKNFRQVAVGCFKG